MKQDLWLVNSSLTVMFALALAVFMLLQEDPPLWRAPRIFTPLTQPEPSKEASQPTSVWEKIYLDDIFSTYIPREVAAAAKQNFITPIPEPKASVVTPPPEIKKIEFVAPLSITLKGIIAGSDEEKNVAMLADEAGKESMYHLGEKIKDAQLIKIAHNRVVLLRANGQQEIFYLRKDDSLLEEQPGEKWKNIVRKIDEQNYQIDPVQFSDEVDSLGNFIERAAVIGATYEDKKIIGIRIGKIESTHDVATALGLLENDIITTVNDLDITDQKNRISAYDAIRELPSGSTVKVGLKRSGKDMTISYKIAKFERPRKKAVFPGIKVTEQPAPSPQQPADLFKPNRSQQREQDLREFNKVHPNEQRHQQSMMEIRRRILENLQNRSQSPRNN